MREGYNQVRFRTTSHSWENGLARAFPERSARKGESPALGNGAFLGGWEDLGKALTYRSDGIGKGSRQAAAAGQMKQARGFGPALFRDTDNSSA